MCSLVRLGSVIGGIWGDMLGGSPPEKISRGLSFCPPLLS